MKQTTIFDALLIISLILIIFTRCKTPQYGNMGGIDVHFGLTGLVERIDSIEKTKLKDKRL